MAMYKEQVATHQRMKLSILDDAESSKKRRKCVCQNRSECQSRKSSQAYKIFFDHECERLRHSQITVPPSFSSKASEPAKILCEDYIYKHQDQVASLGSISKMIRNNWKNLSKADQEFYDALARAKFYL